MSVTVKEIEENGITYRITEDTETGLYIKESLQPPPPEPEPGLDKITQLQLALAELAEAYEQDMTDVQLALAELAEIVTGGGE